MSSVPCRKVCKGSVELAGAAQHGPPMCSGDALLADVGINSPGFFQAAERDKVRD